MVSCEFPLEPCCPHTVMDPRLNGTFLIERFYHTWLVEEMSET